MQQRSDLEEVAALAGEPRHVSAAGVTRSGVRLPTLENGSPFETTSRRRIVMVAVDDRARRILRSLAAEYRERDLFGAPFALAVREVVERHPPAGLELTAVDWGLRRE